MTQEGKKKVTFCSNCGSTNIKPYYSMGIIDSRVECLDCKTFELPIESSKKEWENFLEGKKND
ncbi:MAG: hypothetical protein NUV57_05445 [archaeon]|nr:hypothetical protein [archaeon]